MSRQLPGVELSPRMKRLWILSGSLFLLILSFVVWYVVASDYGDSVATGIYYFDQNGQTSTLALKRDHIFQQELSHEGKVERATGTWHRSGEGGINFSKEFLLVPGQERLTDGTAFADIHKTSGFFVSLVLRQYYVLWYGRVDLSPANTVSGTYAGEEPGVSATLILKPDNTFEQVIHTLGSTKQAKGNWIVGRNGDIIFSKDFLKATGEPLRSDETASAWDPKGSNLQIEVAMTSSSGVPTFRKKQFF